MPPPPAALRWQCRRSCKELDLLLQRYLDHRYPQADEQERRRFWLLLGLDDSQLLALALECADQADPVACLLAKPDADRLLMGG